MKEYPYMADKQTSPAEDPLVYFQTLVARRADELWNEYGRTTGHDLECWLQAEREVFEGIESHALLAVH